VYCLCKSLTFITFLTYNNLNNTFCAVWFTAGSLVKGPRTSGLRPPAIDGPSLETLMLQSLCSALRRLATKCPCIHFQLNFVSTSMETSSFIRTAGRTHSPSIRRPHQNWTSKSKLN